ncbi:MAG TPA: N-acetyl-gamma-glutamyl-phosphate reductase [Solirubrobacteraceae bacterium]|jgi:N-acetyl-gamma-glutamyl-phosphate reductase|nr:N-acetyl-gamma-glutamyl-phosphate reductase [Solirubrobacteraceae bacterium]
MPRVLVAGATGFAGALAAHLLWRHPEFELQTVTARTDAGRRLDRLYPRYRVPLELQELDLDRHVDVDAAIVAYPHAASAPVVAALRARGVRVCDLSADFRLRELATYEQWYGSHSHPELLDEAVYGLPELHRAAIARAALVATPGCYPTASLLALAPLARAGLIADLVIDAKQGLSGAGRSATWQTHFSNSGENIIPYNIVHHRHTPEIEQQLSGLDRALSKLRVQFTPHLVPLDQGELVDCYVTPTRPVAQDELDVMYEDAYAGEPFVELAPAPAEVRDVRETNICRLHVALSEHTGKIVVLSAIDNLWKGTSSQAVQNLNLMFGFPESEGLS